MNTRLKEVLAKERSFQVQFRSVDGSNTEKVVVEGIASTADIDSYGTIIEPSAYADSMRAYLDKNPIVLLQHDHEYPIGIVTEYSIKPEGLFVRAEITEDREGVKSAILNRVLRGFSIGFNPLAYEFRMVGEQEVIVFTRIEIKEISVVSVPANPNTFFSLARSMKLITDEARAARSEDTQDATAPAAAVPENTTTVSEPVQAPENAVETPAPAQAVEVEQAKEEDVKPVETTDATAPDAAAAQAQAEAEAKAQEEAAAKAKADAEAAAQAQAEAEKAQLSQELTEAKSQLESERSSRKAAEDKLEALEKTLAAERSARAESDRQLTIAKTRGFSSGTPVSQGQASYRMPSLVEIARNVHA